MYPPCEKPILDIDTIRNQYTEKKLKLEELCAIVTNHSKEVVPKPVIDKITLLQLQTKLEKQFSFAPPNKLEYTNANECIHQLVYQIKYDQMQIESLEKNIMQFETDEDKLYSKIEGMRKDGIKKPSIHKQVVSDTLDHIRSNSDKYYTLLNEYIEQKKQLHTWKEYCDRVTQKQEQIQKLDQHIEHICTHLKNIPFNENCKACLSNPLRIQMNELREEKRNVVQALHDINSSIPAKPSESNINMTQEWIHEYEGKVALEKSYTQILGEWNDFEERTILLDQYTKELTQLREKIKDFRHTNACTKKTMKQYQVDLENYTTIKNMYEKYVVSQNHWDERIAYIVSVKAQWNLYEQFLERSKIEKEKIQCEATVNKLQQLETHAILYNNYETMRKNNENDMDALRIERRTLQRCIKTKKT